LREALLRAATSVLTVGLFVAATPAVVQALPTAKITMTLTQNPPDYDVPMKVKIKIVLSAPTTNLGFRVQGNGVNAGNCQPAADCLTYFGAPQWLIPSASGTVYASFDNPVVYGATFDFTTDSGMSQNGYVRLVIRLPTTTTKLTVSAPGVILPGTNLHIHAIATGNAKEASTLAVRFPATGFGTPFNLPSGAEWNGSDVHEDLVLNPTAGFAFDVPVTAPVGTKLRIEAIWELLYVPEKSSYTFTVGAPLPTPTPRPTPTPKPTPKPTARPSPTATPATSTPSDSQEATASPSAEPTVDSASGPPPSEGPSPIAAPSLPPPSPSTTSEPASGLTGSQGPDLGVVVLAIVLAGIVGGALAWTRRPKTR
jgi:hypothetical protein